MYLIKSKLIVLLATILLLSSCAGVKPIQIRTVEETTPIQHPNLPNPIKLQDIEWHVITEDNLDEFIQMLRDTKSHVVFFAITPDNYEVMAYNLQDIRRYIKELKEIIVYYKSISED
tara:strand:+ start:827 stop:1177 length:351 start_codon:yes stop_codon:yes gene_type:complete